MRGKTMTPNNMPHVDDETNQKNTKDKKSDLEPFLELQADATGRSFSEKREHGAVKISTKPSHTDTKSKEQKEKGIDKSSASKNKTQKPETSQQLHQKNEQPTKTDAKSKQRGKTESDPSATKNSTGEGTPGPSTADANNANQQQAADGNGEKQEKRTSMTDWKTKAKAVHCFKQQTHSIQAQHRLASTHLAARQYFFFTVPTAVLNLAAGILAFLATGKGLGFSTFVTTIMTALAGSISFVVVFLQTLSSKCKYDVRAEMHGGTAVDLDHLRCELIASLLFHQRHGSNDSKAGENALDSLQTQYNQCIKGCKSNLPEGIQTAFNMLNSRINRFLTKENQDDLNLFYPNQHNDVIYYEACDTLKAKFLGSEGWPLFLPNPVRAVDSTMAEIEKGLQKSVCAILASPSESTVLMAKNV